VWRNRFGRGFGPVVRQTEYWMNEYMDLRLATVKAVSLYLLHNVSILNKCRKLSCGTLCVNTLPATKVILITDGISFGTIRVNYECSNVKQWSEMLTVIIKRV
jgi:hypothetical protein